MIGLIYFSVQATLPPPDTHICTPPVSSKQRATKKIQQWKHEWFERLPIFLLVYRASTHNTTGLTPACLVLGTELRLPCDLFGAPPNKEWPTINHVGNLMDHLHVSDSMKTHYDRLVNCAVYHDGDRVWPYRPTRIKGESPKLQTSREGLYKLVTKINDVYRGSSGTLDWVWWWYTWTAWHLIREVLRTSGLEEGAARAVGE
jgi:hypothetical protein